MSGDIDRTQFIGGSDTAAIIGVSPWKSAFQLYQEKIGAYVEDVTPQKQRIFARGKRWEPVVVEMIVDELRHQDHDVEVMRRNRRYQDKEFTFLAAEIDLELGVDGEQCNVEIKTVHPFAAKAWGEPGSDEIPIYYAAQAMHGLMVTKRRRCIVAALIGADDLRIHEIVRDDETIAGIRAKELAFWQRVQDRNPPDPQTAEDVRWLYAKDLGEVAEADDELLRLVGELHFQKTTAKHAEAAIDRISTQIKLAMGNAALLLRDGRLIATWKSNKQSRKTDWQAIAGELNAPQELIERYTKTVAGNRPLLLKL
jgi:putative phage-type endonuclease